MSDEKITVDLQERQIVGKGLAKLRADGSVPAVIHNHGKASIHVTGDFLMLAKAYAAAGKHHPVELKVGSKHHLALIKDVDFEPTKHRMRHIVFQAIKQNEAVEAEVPVIFQPDVEIPAEKKSLLVLKKLDTVQVKALPKDLPDELQVSPAVLDEVGSTLTVADIVIPAGVTLLTPPETPLAVVEMPKDQIAEANAAAEALAEDAATKGEEEVSGDQKSDDGKEPAEEE